MLKKVSSQLKQRGIGLLELMLSLSIIAILLVMATRYFVMANESQKINNALSIVNGFAGAAAQYAVTTHTYSGMTIKNLIEGNYLPASFGGDSTQTGVGANPWGGNLTLNVPSSNSFTLTLTSIPMGTTQSPTTCTKLEAAINSANPNLVTTGCTAGGATSSLTVTYN